MNREEKITYLLERAERRRLRGQKLRPWDVLTPDELTWILVLVTALAMSLFLLSALSLSGDPGGPS